MSDVPVSRERVAAIRARVSPRPAYMRGDDDEDLLALCDTVDALRRQLDSANARVVEANAATARLVELARGSMISTRRRRPVRPEELSRAYRVRGCEVELGGDGEWVRDATTSAAIFKTGAEWVREDAVRYFAPLVWLWRSVKRAVGRLTKRR